MTIDATAAAHIETAANIVSGLELSEIHVDAHDVANVLWLIAAYLRRRNR